MKNRKIHSAGLKKKQRGAALFLAFLLLGDSLINSGAYVFASEPAPSALTQQESGENTDKKEPEASVSAEPLQSAASEQSTVPEQEGTSVAASGEPSGSQEGAGAGISASPAGNGLPSGSAQIVPESTPTGKPENSVQPGETTQPKASASPENSAEPSGSAQAGSTPSGTPGASPSVEPSAGTTPSAAPMETTYRGELGGLSVEVTGNLAKDGSLEVSEIEDELFDRIGEELTLLSMEQGYSLANLSVMDLALVDEEENVLSLEGNTVTVRLGGMAAGINSEELKMQVYYMKETGKELTAAAVDTWVEDEDVCFATDHFSVYALAVLSSSEENRISTYAASEVSLLGQLKWEDEEWQELTRPTAGEGTMLKLYIWPKGVSGFDPTDPRAEEITLQTASTASANHLSYQITSGEDYWTYRMNHITVDLDTEDLYVTAVTGEGKLLSYKTADSSAYAAADKTTSSGIEMKTLTLAPDERELEIAKMVVGETGSATTFSFSLKVGKTAALTTTNYTGSYTVNNDGNPSTKTASGGTLAGVKDGGAATAKIPVGIFYQVTEIANENYITVYDEKASGVIIDGENKTKVTNLPNNSKVTLTKIWNDNNSKDRMTGAEWLSALKLYYSLEGSTDRVELTEESKADIGIIGEIVCSVSETSYNKWQASYTNGGKSNFPSYTGDGKKITYYIGEDAAQMQEKSYLPSTEAAESGATLTNTRTESLTGTIKWADESQKTRRPVSVILDLYRYEGSGSSGAGKIGTIMLESAGSGSAGVIFDDGSSAIVGSNQVSGNQWEFAIPGLVSYSEGGEVYTYYVKQQEISGYDTAYDNGKGSHGTVVAEGYSGVVITNTLTGVASYRAYKKWQDESADARCAGTLYLYRYPSNKTPAAAAPVILLDDAKNSVVIKKELSALDSLSGDITGTQYVIDFSDVLPTGKSLQQYNEDGYEYIYFVKEILSGETYVKAYDNNGAALTESGLSAEEANACGVFHEGTLTNTRTGEMEYTVTKEWKTAALQDVPKNMTVYVQLEQKPASSANAEDWASVSGEILTELEVGYDPALGIPITGFSAEILTKDLVLLLPEFDTSGRKLEYRVSETAVVEQTAAEKKTLSIINGKITTAKGYTYASEIQKAGENKTVITNTLTGTLNYTIIKRWTPAPANAEEATVTINLYRTDHNGIKEAVSVAGSEDINLKAENHYVPDKQGEEEDTSLYWKKVVQDLPRYDSEGYEYTYTVNEKNHDGIHPEQGGGYATYISYARNQATVSNVTGAKSKNLWVKKVWKDDGDTLYRQPVWAGLYDNNGDLLQTICLSEENAWQNRFSVGVTENVSDYTIREMGMAGDITTLSAPTYQAEYTAFDWSTDTASGNTVKTLTGKVTTGDYVYKAVNVCTYTGSGDDSDISCVITNTRTGTMSVKVTKIWRDGSRPDEERPRLTLTLTNDADATSQEVIIDFGTGVEADRQGAKSENNTWTYSFTGLNKYDANGRIIHYAVAEAITPQVVGSTNDDYHSEVEDKGYETGSASHTGDVQSITITNTREGKTDYTVYKKWKDLSATDSRPDIYVELYYRIGEASSSQVNVIKKYERTEETVATDIWVGSPDYVWKEADGGEKAYDSYCTVNGLNHYTPDGEEIFYFTKETINAQSSEYAAVYYKDKHAAEEVTVGKYAPDEGCIVNRLEKEITVSGVKVWTNLQEGTEISDYSDLDVSLRLYRYTGARPAAEGMELEEEYFVAEKKLESPYTSFEFRKGDVAFKKGGTESMSVPSLDKYDENGSLYIYEIVEVMKDEMKRVYTSGTNVFKLTNTFIQGPDNNRKITVKKSWSGLSSDDIGKLGIDGAALKLPRVTFKLYRVLSSENYSPAGPETGWELCDTKTYEATDLLQGSVTFEKLLVWAENGGQYKYAVQEQVESVPGYAIGVSAEGDSGFGEGNWYVIADSNYAQIADVTEKTVTFTNTFKGATGNTLTLQGTKNWVDANSTTLRPLINKPPTLTVYRWAVGNGSDNSIGTRETELPADYYTINWTDNGNGTWAYTITSNTADGKYGVLEYAPNGSPFQYRVVETEVENYKADKTEATQSGSVSGESGSRIQKLTALTNRLSTTHKVTKTWEDNGNRYGLRPDFVIVKLQRQAAGTAAWEDVSYYENMSSGNGAFKEEGDANPIARAKLSPENNWSYTFQNLAPQDGSGNTYTYRVVECGLGIENEDSTGTIVPVADGASTAGSYNLRYDKNVPGVTAITNTQRSTGYTVIKRWVDNSNRYNSRPENASGIPQISIKLQMTTVSGSATDTDYQTIGTYAMQGTGDELTLTFEGLPGYDINGKEYKYRAVEVTDNIQNYVATEDWSTNSSQTIITNTLKKEAGTGELQTLIASKVWENGTGSMGKAGENVTLELKRYVREDTGSETYTELPYYPRKTITLDGTQDSDGEETAYTAVWKDLPALHNNGTTIQYKVEEISAPSGYLTTIEQTDDKGLAFRVTNTESTSLEVAKKWEDENNRYETRPAAIHVKLQRKKKPVNGGETGQYTDVSAEDLTYGTTTGTPQVIKELTADAGGSWKAEFTQLPRYGFEGNVEYEYLYRAVEVTDQSGTTSIDQNGQNGAYRVIMAAETTEQANTSYWNAAEGKFTQTITNRLITGSLTVSKKWVDDNNRDGVRTQTVKLEIKHDNASYTEPLWAELGEGKADCSVNAEGNVELTLTGLPVYKADGTKIKYSAAEFKTGEWERLDAYTTVYTPASVELEAGDADKAVEIRTTNTYAPRTLTKTVKKIWEGDGSYSGSLTSSVRPESVTVYLMMTYTNAGGASVTTYVNADGTPALNPDGTPKAEATAFSTKVLQGNTDPAKDWTASWEGLFVYSNEGGAIRAAGVSQEIVYAVTETPVPGYTTQITSAENDFTVTNTMKETQVKAHKIWTDENNDYSTRPASISFTLQRKRKEEGEDKWKDLAEAVTESMSVDTFADITFTGLPVCDLAGKEYQYRVREKPVSGYTASYEYAKNTETDGASQVTTVTDHVTNTLETVSISGTKKWVGDTAVRRPSSVTLKVYGSADGGASYTILAHQPTPAWSNTETDEWQYTISGIPKYAAGSNTPMRYYVAEEDVLGYESAYPESSRSDGAVGVVGSDGSITGANITNTQKKVTISGTKYWQDDRDKYGFRPQEVTLTLLVSENNGSYVEMAAGTYQVQWNKSSGADEWTYTIANLPRSGSTGDYSYKLKENVPEGYRATSSFAVNGSPVNGTEEIVIEASKVPADGQLDGVNFTNKLKTGALLVTKTLDISAPSGCQNDTFYFRIMLTRNERVNGISTPVELGYYSGSYAVYGQNNNPMSDTPLRTGNTTGADDAAGEGWIALKAGEKFYVQGLPAGYGYRLEERQTGYVAAYTPQGSESGTIGDGTTEITVTNSTKPVLAIENQTVNKSNAETGDTDAGGKVGITKGTNTITDKNGVSYTQEAVEATWISAPYWTYDPEFVVACRDYGSEDYTEYNLTLVEQGDSLSLGGADLTGFMTKYTGASVEKNASGNVVLKLASSAALMPAVSEVYVGFVPTTAAINLTENFDGGKVGVESATMNETSDGIPSLDGNSRYAAHNSVYASANAGYCIDTTKIAIGAPEVLVPSTGNPENGRAVRAFRTSTAPPSAYITPDASGNFSVTIALPINEGTSEDVTVNGTISYTRDGNGNPIAALITLQDLKASLDIAVTFKTIPPIAPSGNNGGKNDKSDSSGDESKGAAEAYDTSDAGEEAVTGTWGADGTWIPIDQTTQTVQPKEEKKQESTIPRTGDGFELWLWVLLAAGSLTTAVWMLWLLVTEDKVRWKRKR